MSSPATPDDPGAEQPFISHLIELRDRLIRMVLAIVVVFLALFPFANQLYTTVAAPIMAILPEGVTMIATQVASPFLTPFKLALVVAVFAVMPYLLYQFWAFVAPGLYQHEKRLAVPLLASSIVLFYLGMAFAYFAVFPLIFTFFSSVTPEGVTQMPDIAFYLEFILKLFFAFGFAFEIPIATILLVAIGATTPEQLANKRPYVIVGAFIAGMLLTPPDVISQTLLALPMWLLFELGIFLSRLMARRRAGAPGGDGGGAAPAGPGGGQPPPTDRPSDGHGGAGTDRERPHPAAAFSDESIEAELDAVDAAEMERAGPSATAAKLAEAQRLHDQDGDRSEARRLLDEVLGEGSVDQRLAAQALLEQIGTD